jgi:hypothetical protein
MHTYRNLLGGTVESSENVKSAKHPNSMWNRLSGRQVTEATKCMNLRAWIFVVFGSFAKKSDKKCAY